LTVAPERLNVPCDPKASGVMACTIPLPSLLMVSKDPGPDVALSWKVSPLGDLMK
jgi:hypothetical protein